MNEEKKKNMPLAHELEFQQSVSQQLDEVASVIKAVSMINRGEVQVQVMSFDEQVVLPQGVMPEILEVLKKYYEDMKPVLLTMADGLK